jgi:1,4-dihydroxy-2-naphthoyl-CoA hydrolase
MCDLNVEYPVGLEVNANHIGGIKSGYVIGIGKMIHSGKKTHVWQVDIFDESNDKLICTGRLTVMIIQKK